MPLKIEDQHKIIATDGIKLDQRICDIILDESDRNSFEYGEDEFKHPRFTNLYWFLGRLFSLGTHGEVYDITEKYWPITRWAQNKYKKENKDYAQ